MSHRLRTISLSGLVLTLLSSAIAQTARKVTPVISVKGSKVTIAVSERARKKPSLSAEQLAAYGNDLIARKGFDYELSLCDMLTDRELHPTEPGEIVRNRQMTLTNGEKRTFSLTIENPYNSLCGECWVSIPILEFTSKAVTLIAEGKRYQVRRTPWFILEEANLVDETLKKVSRTWQMPYQGWPTGISADGTKLYLDFFGGNDLDHLVLELSENGPPQFRDRAVMQSSEGEFIDHPRDPNNGYLSFMRFRVGGKIYRVKFTAPCT